MKQKSKLTIPEIRSRLYVLAKNTGLKELKFLADQTRRIYIKPKTRTKSKRITPTLKAEVYDYWSKNKHLSCSEIGLKFFINQGRVSEIIGGK